MSKKDKTKKKRKNCLSCLSCLRICNGGFYCEKFDCFVVKDFGTTPNYFKCKGERWESND